MGIMIGTGLITATFGYGFGAGHHQSTTLAALSLVITISASWLGFHGIFAFRIVGATVKNTEAAAPLNHLTIFTDRAGYARRILIVLAVLNKFTFWVVAAGYKFAKATLPLYLLSVLAIRTSFSDLFGAG